MRTSGTLRAATHLTLRDFLTPPPTPAPTKLLHVTLKEKKKRGDIGDPTVTTKLKVLLLDLVNTRGL